MLAHTIHKSKNTPHTPLPHTPKHSPHRPTRKSMSYRRWHAGTNHTGCPLRHPTAHPPNTHKKMPEGIMPNLLQTTPRARSATQANHPGSTDEPDQQNTPVCQRLLRKEVIQPHLPVRLPCSDFVPITGPTFTHSLPTKWGCATSFGCCQLS